MPILNTSDLIHALRNKDSHFIVSEKLFKNEYTIEVLHSHLIDILSFVKASGFEVLMDLTAVDYLLPQMKTKVVYLLHNPVNFERVRLFLYAARDEKIPSVTCLWEGADWYEREVFDLFGVYFKGHPSLKRILMPDDWVGHPLQKDYALTEESVQFKHGVKPKVPSEIIPYVNKKP